MLIRRHSNAKHSSTAYQESDSHQWEHMAALLLLHLHTAEITINEEWGVEHTWFEHKGDSEWNWGGGVYISPLRKVIPLRLDRRNQSALLLLWRNLWSE